MSRLPIGVLLALVLSACSGASSTAPSAPPSSTTPPVTPPSTFTYAGTITATNGGAAIAGATVSFGGRSTTTDGAGAFTFTFTGAAPTSAAAQIASAGIVSRSTQLQLAAHTGIAIDVFQTGPTFDLAFFRQLVRDGFESPGALQPIRHFTTAPSLYIRTVDEAGQPIDGATLDAAQAAMTGVAPTWTGGRFGLAGVQRGTATMEGVSGWLTVKWMNPRQIGFCGEATAGVDGGSMSFNYLNPNCACGAAKMYLRAYRHELGHALARYWHTDSPSDVMWGGGTTNATCDLQPSQREQLYAGYAYRRANGNTDPDTDAASVALSLAPAAPRMIRD